MRRRLHFVRQRGSLLAHIQITHHQYNLGAPGKRITYRSNREGLGEGFEDPSVRHSIAADLALADHFEVVIGELELAVLRQARVHDPQALQLLTSVPGIGKILALTILYEIHDISRFPTVRDFASYSRLVKCERSSAGKSHPYLKWAFSEAAVLFIAKSEQGRTVLARLERKYGKPKALSVLAHKLGRAVLSLHRSHGCLALFFVVSAPHPSPVHTGGVLPHATACTCLEWDGTREPTCF
jgi:transposase